MGNWKRFSQERSLSIISQKCGIPKSSICTFKKNGNENCKKVGDHNYGSKHRRSLKPGEYPKMEKSLFNSNHAKEQLPVNGIILKAKALKIQNKIYGSGFHASDEKECGEKLSARKT